MKSTFFNNNESKKKQIVIFNIMTLSIVFLILFGQVNSITIGLGKHELKDGKVTLAEGSRIAYNNDDLEQYKKNFIDACDINFDTVGNIVFHYKKGGAAEKGCTVDLLTNDKHHINFLTGLENAKGLSCITHDLNDNVLPFAFSLSSDEINKKFRNIPIKGDCSQQCGGEDCIEKTLFEISWSFFIDHLENQEVLFNLNPVITHFDQIANIKDTLPKIYLNVSFTQVEENKNQATILGFLYRQSYFCLKDNIMNKVNSPALTWEINNKIDDKIDRLLVFYFLPQKAIFKRIKNEKGKFELKDQTNGPKCDDLKIIFLKENYQLLTSNPPEIPITTTTTTSKSPQININNNVITDPQGNVISTTTNTNEDNSTATTTNDENLKNSTKNDRTVPTTDTTDSSEDLTSDDTTGNQEITTASNTQTTTTNKPTTTSSFGFIVLIVIGGIILVIIIVAIVCCVIKKKSKKEKDAEGGGDEKKKKEGGAEGEEAKQEDGAEEEKKEENGEEGEKNKSKKDDDKSKKKGKKSKDEGDKSKEDDTKSKEDEKSKEGETKNDDETNKDEETTGATSVDTEAKKKEEEDEEEDEKKEDEKKEEEATKPLTPEDEAKKKEDDEIYKMS